MRKPPVAERLDQHGITALHVAIVAVCALGFSFDLLEISLGSVLSAVFSAPQQRLESPRWLAAVGRAEEAWAVWRRFERSALLMPPQDSPAADVARQTPVEEVPPAWRPRDVVLMGAIFLLSACGTSGFTLFSGAVMVQKGFKVSDTVLYLGIATTGQFLGTLLTAIIADRVERRTALMSCAVAMAVVVLGFVLSSTVLALLVTGVAYSILMALYLPALFIYATELFPTSRRSSATAYAWTANRVSSALIPFILLPLLRQNGALAMATVIAMTWLLTAGLILGCCPRKPAGLPVS